MAELIRSFTEPENLREVYGVVAVEDEDGELGLADPSAWEIGLPAEGEWLDTGPNGVTLQPSGKGSVHVRYESWSGPPTEVWSADAWSGTILITSGKISALSDVQGDERLHTVFDLGERDAVWNVRVQRKVFENDTEPDFPRHAYHAEFFRLQFWPTAP
ncbi:hypothetical protein Skr01_23590 [Sphaerisporangium krabiense]|uniref:Uncharacterized protein n=1 Tax=Sphaerisporangium krabiense TaxID=763782 RepID=A0A7W8Z5Y1_9ACTN|nr:hypothetical protein [Sphaerisporangium krabiense]MBB5628107.1 hypothetical protein [Sphaerisporangium krabiense]GII62274.1 hypothetical protein Skr01_23590 [Sphaerisporangium krabiense]